MSGNKCVPCFDTTIKWNHTLMGLLRYRHATSRWFRLLSNEMKSTSIKNNVQDNWPFDVINQDKMILEYATVIDQNVRALQNREKYFKTEFHKQLCLALIETDTAYFNRWITLSRSSSNPKFNNSDFISALEEAVKCLNECFDVVVLIPSRRR